MCGPDGIRKSSKRKHKGTHFLPSLSKMKSIHNAVTDTLAQCAGVIGVDSGLSHIAVALDVPHVQIYNFDTAWRTGPQGLARQRGVYASPHPAMEHIWQAWKAVQTVMPGVSR